MILYTYCIFVGQWSQKTVLDRVTMYNIRTLPTASRQQVWFINAHNILLCKSTCMSCWWSSIEGRPRSVVTSSWSYDGIVTFLRLLLVISSWGCFQCLKSLILKIYIFFIMLLYYVSVCKKDITYHTSITIVWLRMFVSSCYQHEITISMCKNNIYDLKWYQMGIIGYLT